MPSTTTPDTTTEATIAEHKAAISAALETRAARKEELRELIKKADHDFAQVIAAARQDKVPWRDICGAADMSRQMTNELLRTHTDA